jgi:glyoxylase-like metal-dependent hydrolase (beta-lactamase superfamily II)
VIKELEALNIKLSDISMILITHCDIDHIGGANYFVKKIKCPIYTSAGEKANYLKKSKEIIKKHLYLILSKKINSKKILTLPENKIGDFKIIDAPGHCYDMKMFLYKDVLFAGDLIQTRKGVIEICPHEYNLNKDLYIKTLKSLDMSNVNLICQGHGKPIVAHPA